MGDGGFAEKPSVVGGGGYRGVRVHSEPWGVRLTATWRRRQWLRRMNHRIDASALLLMESLCFATGVSPPDMMLRRVKHGGVERIWGELPCDSCQDMNDDAVVHLKMPM